MLIQKLRPIVWCALGIFAFSACRQEVDEPAPGFPNTGYLISEVTQADAPSLDIKPFWLATYYDNGSLKSLSDDRDSSYVEYAYKGREIIGKDISPPTSWRVPFAEYRLKLNDRQQVTESYLSGNDNAGGQRYDSTAYRYDAEGYLVEQLQRSAYLVNKRLVQHTTRMITTTWRDGNPVEIRVTDDFRPAAGPATREAFTIKQEYYPDKTDGNNIQAFLRLFGYTWTARAIPFLKAPKNLLKKVSYLAADGSKTGEWEYAYESANVEGHELITRITSTETRGTSVMAPVRYAVRYHVQ
jgi:hypothetical protein